MLRSDGSVAGVERAAIGELDVLVVAVQARRAVAAGAEAVGGDEGAGVLDLAAEVRRVEASAEDRLVHLAQLGEGELVGEQAVGDAAVADLVAQAPQRVVDDLVVVEGEAGERRRVEPRDVLDRVASVISSARSSAQYTIETTRVGERSTAPKAYSCSR